MPETRKKRASSRPLVPGGSNYTAMHLVFQPHLIRVKPSLWCYFFAGLIMLSGLPALIFPVMLFFHYEGDLIFAGVAVAAFILGGFLFYAAVRMLHTCRKRCRSLFDLSTRVFYPNGKNNPAIPFSEFSSLQIVEEHCSAGKGSFDSFELNIVLRDGRRFNLLDHGNRECFAEEAEHLSRELSLPLTDAQGKCLSCDSFLSLPSNIRENLLFGSCALLICVIFFAFGDGHSWYLTRQSFQWEKTPASVESAKIRRHSGRRTTYSLDFQFRYRYRGRSYTGTKYNFFNMRSSEYAVEKLVRQYPPGKKMHCYVNPRLPEQAVVDRTIPPFWEILLQSPWSSCFLIMGVFCLLKAASQYRLLKRRRQKNLH